MNNTMKKWVSLIMVCLMMLTSIPTAFAYESEEELTVESETSQLPDDNETPEDSEDPENNKEPENPDEQPQEPEENENTIVATATLFAAMYVFPVSGHTWIYVENLTDEPITVGLYEVPVNQGVSVGTFSFSVNDGWGIYYNLEAFRENRNDNIGGCRSRTIELTRSELEELSESIRDYPNLWDIFIFNCTFFAFSIWNGISDDFLIPMMIPAMAILEVIILGSPKGVKSMYYPTSDQVFKQKGRGNEAHLEPVGEKTLSK